MPELTASGLTKVNGKYLYTNSVMDVEVGDTKQSSFYPQVKFLKWNNEVNFSVRYSSDQTDASQSKNANDVVTWTGKDGTKVHLYEKSGLSISNEDGFEFEFELPSKPSSNVFEMTIQTKGLNFFYQDEITDDEAQSQVDIYQKAYDDGHEVVVPTLAEAKRMMRPDNVVGSYAVYHESKKDNEYKTGKAFHIYRPEAVDSKGNKIWCELNIDAVREILTITVPQKFLDSAIYPVIVDPTFGYTSIGGSWQNYVQNQGFGGKYTANATTQIDSLTFYAKRISSGGSTPQPKIVMWEGGTLPASILTNGVGPAISVTDLLGAWYTANYSSKPSVSNGTAYRLGAIQDIDIDVAYDGTVEIDPNNYVTPEAYQPYVNNPTFQPSVYATYADTVQIRPIVNIIIL